MKKLIIVVQIMLWSCNKTESVAATTSHADTVGQKSVIEDAASAPVTEVPTGRHGMMREVDGNKIIRTADAAQIPFNIGEEFTEEDQQFILKIKNFDRQNISGEISPEDPEMNIRFNQIKLPGGETYGPFARGMIFKTKENGEIWIVIGKNNMASGKTKGKFSVSIK